MKVFCRLAVSVVTALTLVMAGVVAEARTSLDPLLKLYLERYDMPALAAAVVKDGRIVAAGAVGTRRIGTLIPVTIDDRFHIGSDTKAMTALLAAMLVEQGRLRWNSTIGECFPELSGNMDVSVKRITLEQLLSHTSGLPSDNDELGKTYMEAMLQDGNLDEMRYWLVKQWLGRSLKSSAGGNFAYSNLGYVIVGAMIERKTGKTWDEAITEMVFKPLGLKNAGLGPQASMGKVDAPLAHSLVGGKPKAMLPGPNGDGPAIIGPAGIAHMSVLDFAKWAGWNAGQGKRGPALVKDETLRRLHAPVISMPEQKNAAPGTPPGGRYALGWGELAPAWAPYTLLYHGGSNSMNLAHIWLDTKRDLAIVIVSNISGQKANIAFHALVAELYGKYGVRIETVK